MQKIKKLLNQTDMLVRVKQFFKKFWGLFVGLGLAVTYFLFKSRKKTEDLAIGIRSSGNQLNGVVDGVITGERTATDEEALRHKEKIAQLRKKYEEEKSKLDKAEAVEAEKIFNEHGNDPVTLAEKLSAATGFKIIMPKD